MAHHHDCECGHDHHHEHEHESNSVQIDRYHEAFNKFEPALPDTQTTEAVNAPVSYTHLTLPTILLV